MADLAMDNGDFYFYSRLRLLNAILFGWTFLEFVELVCSSSRRLSLGVFLCKGWSVKDEMVRTPTFMSKDEGMLLQDASQRGFPES